MKKQSGITMIALVITIVVMFIIFGVTVSMVVNDEDVITRARNAEAQSNESKVYEEVYAAWSATEMEYWNSAELVSRDEYFTPTKLNEHLVGKGNVEVVEYVENGNSKIKYTSNADGKTYDLEIYTAEANVDEIPEDELTKATYTVTFYNEDGTAVLDTVEVTAESDAEYSKSIPEKEGYTFKYWALDKAGTKQANLSNITENMTVYPYFKINEYTVTYYNADGTVFYTETVNYNNDAVYQTVPTQSGYTFQYWATSVGGGTEANLSNIKADTSVYAYFIINTSSTIDSVGFAPSPS